MLTPISPSPRHWRPTRRVGSPLAGLLFALPLLAILIAAHCALNRSVIHAALPLPYTSLEAVQELARGETRTLPDLEFDLTADPGCEVVAVTRVEGAPPDPYAGSRTVYYYTCEKDRVSN